MPINKPHNLLYYCVVFAVFVHVGLLWALKDVLKPKTIVASMTEYRISLRADEEDSAAKSEKVKAKPSKVQKSAGPKKADTYNKVSQPVAASSKQTPKSALKSKSAVKPLPIKTAAAKPKPIVKKQPSPIRTVKTNKQVSPLAAKAAIPAQNKSLKSLPPRPVKNSAAAPQTSAIANTENPAALAKLVSEQAADTQSDVITERNIQPPKYEIGSAQNPRPNYPNIAKQRGWEGDVLLGVHVNSAGEVTYVEILQGSDYSPLDFAAYEVVRTQWQFDPALHREEAVKGFIAVPISFRL